VVGVLRQILKAFLVLNVGDFKNEDISLRSGLNATEVISYQYLGMTKIAGALNMLPKTTILQDITNLFLPAMMAVPP
jgi:hypothetical protein